MCIIHISHKKLRDCNVKRIHTYMWLILTYNTDKSSGQTFPNKQTRKIFLENGFGTLGNYKVDKREFLFSMTAPGNEDTICELHFGVSLENLIP